MFKILLFIFFFLLLPLFWGGHVSKKLWSRTPLEKKMGYLVILMIIVVYYYFIVSVLGPTVYQDIYFIFN